jgi:hypothetical protein
VPEQILTPVPSAGGGTALAGVPEQMLTLVPSAGGGTAPAGVPGPGKMLTLVPSAGGGKTPAGVPEQVLTLVPSAGGGTTPAGVPGEMLHPAWVFERKPVMMPMPRRAHLASGRLSADAATNSARFVAPLRWEGARHPQGCRSRCCTPRGCWSKC